MSDQGEGGGNLAPPSGGRGRNTPQGPRPPGQQGSNTQGQRNFFGQYPHGQTSQYPQGMGGMGMGMGMGIPQMGGFSMGFQGNPMMGMGGYGGFNPMMGMGMGQMGMLPNAFMGMGMHPGMMAMQGLGMPGMGPMGMPGMDMPMGMMGARGFGGRGPGRMALPGRMQEQSRTGSPDDEEEEEEVEDEVPRSPEKPPPGPVPPQGPPPAVPPVMASPLRRNASPPLPQEPHPSTSQPPLPQPPAGPPPQAAPPRAPSSPAPSAAPQPPAAASTQPGGIPPPRPPPGPPPLGILPGPASGSIPPPRPPPGPPPPGAPAGPSRPAGSPAVPAGILESPVGWVVPGRVMVGGQIVGGKRSRGDFDSPKSDSGLFRGGARFKNNLDVPEGTAARPGKRTRLLTVEESTNALNDTVESLPPDIKALGLAPRPKRPSFGTLGRRVKIKANHFRVTCGLRQASLYEVVIDYAKHKKETELLGESSNAPTAPPPKLLPPEINRKVLMELSQRQGWGPVWAYNGKTSIYTPTALLPQTEMDYAVTVFDEDSRHPKNYSVTMKWVQDVNLEPLAALVSTSQVEIPESALEAADVILRHSSAINPLCFPFGRSFYFPNPQTIRTLTYGAEIWLGYQQALRPCEGGLTLNVDTVATPFIEEAPVIAFLAKALGLANAKQLQHMTPEIMDRANKLIAGVKVQNTGMPVKRTYKVKRLADFGPGRQTFMHADTKQEVTVAQHYLVRYQIKLQDLDTPCLSAGTAKKPCYLPPELFHVRRGQRKPKLNERQANEMVKVAAQKPYERASIINRNVSELSRLPTDPVAAAFQMHMQRTMIDIPARILAPPELMYRRPFQTDDKGRWDLRFVQFHRPATLVSYGIVSYVDASIAAGINPRDPAGIPEFMRQMLDQMRERGMGVPAMARLPEIVYHNPADFPGESMARAADIGKAFFKQRCQILFVVLPDANQDMYKEVKRASDSFLGIPSQCLVAERAGIGGVAMRKSRDFKEVNRRQYCANVSLKVNAKLDGTNATLATIQPWQLRPYMVMGGDVTHPASYNEAEPSVAAVVGSQNAICTAFSADVQLQGHRIEIIQDLKNICMRLLKGFYRATGYKPERLIFYRDGVSEGSFAEVQRTEIPQVAEACRMLDEEYAPPLTFITVQKRHSTRMFPTDSNMDGSKNVLPGTVVDTTVTGAGEYDFFLNSHAGIQGTSRPAHYHVLLDQNNMNPDELQAFTYNMCYTFARATRSVSLCPPAYYARLAAFRGRAMLTQLEQTFLDVVDEDGNPLPQSTHAEFAHIHTELANRMYYV